MTDQQDLRISDADRKLAADRLRAAVDEGRLDLFEYDSRLNRAYTSRTYGELDAVMADLPLAAPVVPAPRPADPAPVTVTRPRPARAGMPTALRVLWIIWGAIMAVNLVVWVLVSLGSGFTYFWPMWLLVPGAILAAVTAGVRR
ncbi:DUF1707 domain-containing protein [Nakamurella sp. YIM 132087]|uniref:DUF1707 domain-containing protein n=1 Tax=Nakamurella alba TaxID=2665158 RepID=A0A7K1FMG4_9ACTN|nr:DUF1707 domain-containing protein [Nakamurella alba]MTD15342.1 DUF1707 domain-containing protein [Nakamurella alba]